MLKLRNLIENDQVAGDLLRHYEFGNVEFGFWRSSSNVVYEVNGDGKSYFLRYATEDEKSADMILAELDYILFLREYGICANQPVKTKNGNYLIQEHGYLAVLFEGINGKALDDIELTPKIAKEWGRQLGQIHKANESYRNHKRWDYKEAFSYIRANLSEKEDTLLLDEAGWLESSFEQLLKTKNNYGLCHYDFELDNVFYDDEKEQFSIIDFDDCMYHFYAIDLVQVMMNIEEEFPQEKWNWAKVEFQHGYREYCKFPSEKEIELAKEFVLLLGYAKLTYSLNFPAENAPDWMDEIVDKLSAAKKDKRKQLMEIAKISEAYHLCNKAIL